MTEEIDYEKEAKKLLTALDDAIATGPWDKSVFLKAIGKKLREIRHDYKTKLGLKTEQELEAERHAQQVTTHASRSNQQCVYISLYNADGTNMEKWEKLLLAIERQIITRPVYRVETEIRALIRSKQNKRNEAYISVWIDKDKVLEPQHTKKVTDKLGHELMSLKDGAIKMDNIESFYHESGQYEVQKKSLVRVADMHFSEFLR